MKVEIFDIAFGGAGVARLNDKMVVFVPYALPGEVVEIKNIRRKRKYCEADIENIEKVSSQRIDPVCEYYEKCGGCQYLHLEYASELEYKRNQLIQMLKRIGAIECPEAVDAVGSDQIGNYRNSITLHKNRLNIGFYGIDNKNIVSVLNCHIAAGLINDYFNMNKEKLLKHETEDITIKTDNYKISSVIDRNKLSCSLMGIEFDYDYTTFFQTNINVMNKMLLHIGNKIVDAAALFDLYCGVGVYAILFARGFEKVIGIDNNINALAYAKKHENKNIVFYCKDAQRNFRRIFNKHRSGSNVIIVNPPRTGIDKNLLLRIKEAENIVQIIIVSCNPATLSRDLKMLLADNNFFLESISLFDMFPRTKHFETVSVLRPR